MIVTNGNLDDALDEFAVGFQILLPDALEGFMAFEKLSAIEFVDAFLEIVLVIVRQL